MSPGESSTQNVDERSESPGLSPQTYTSQRLLHGTPEHLHLTSRRSFIGPIPDGWLKSHRRDWYKHRLHLSHYSSRASTFSPDHDASRIRRLTGVGDPSTSAVYGLSFPQPDDLEDEEPPVAIHDPEESGGAATIITTRISQEPGVLDEHMATEAGSSQDNNVPTGPTLIGQSTRHSSFLTAPETTDPRRTSNTSSTSQPSHLLGLDRHESNGTSNHDRVGSIPSPRKERRSISGVPDSPQIDPATPNSRSFLIHRDSKGPSPAEEKTETVVCLPQPIMADAERSVPLDKSLKHKLTGPVRFNVPDRAADRDRRLRQTLSELNPALSIPHRRRGDRKAGEIIKIEKMLVRIDSTVQDLPDDYDEKASMTVDTRIMEKWREYVLVCRQGSSERAKFTLEFYKSRVIPATHLSTQRTQIKKRFTHEIPLSRQTARISLYSTLDKTVMISTPHKTITKIFYLRSRSAASSAEWFTFIRTTLGWSRPDELVVHVPDMALTLRITDAFAKLEARREEALRCSIDDHAMVRTMEAEQSMSHDIIRQCLVLLSEQRQPDEVLQSWSTNCQIGLAWKRYDRLEWVQGANEQRMYGTIAMQHSHDLELRPMQHYPTRVQKLTTKLKIGSASVDENVTAASEKALTEPIPVEGFLIRLTSQRGRDRRFGRMFYKRLYFYTHNQYLCFCRPARAIPIPHPKILLDDGSRTAAPHRITDRTPLVFEYAPFALEDEHIAWLRAGYSESRKVRHDREAFEEAERKLNTLMRAEGFVDLSTVTAVRSVVVGNSLTTDENDGSGVDVDFHAEAPDAEEDDAVNNDPDERRTFELVLQNGLVVRLEAYNGTTKDAWIQRLRDLTRYWRLRKAADLQLFKTVRKANLRKFRIDEDAESYLGQFGQKWEVSGAVASSQMYHVCGLDLCRTIHMSGVLFHKLKRYSTFLRHHVILCHGQLLIFENSLRKRTGTELAFSHHERHSAIDLQDCYIYSGLITASDLPYESQTFDSNHPGRHALPRIYTQDGWTSSDEDLMTYFVIWHNRKKTLFRSRSRSRSDEVVHDRSTGAEAGRQGAKSRTKTRPFRTKIKQVSQLGTEGRATVFKARSRAERDVWVMSISREIERSQTEQGEDFRVVLG